MLTQALGVLCFLLTFAFRVHAEIRQKDFVVLKSKQVTNVHSSLITRSRVFCAKSCLNTGNCFSATFNSSSKECFHSTDGLMNIINAPDDNLVTLLMKGTVTNDHFGMSFFTGFMCNGETNFGTPFLLMISTVPEPTNVFVTIPFLNIYKEQHILNSFLYLQYPISLMSAEGSLISNKGIEVESDNPIALYTLNYYDFAIDGTLEIPNEKWGQLFIVDTHDATLWGTGQILVIATDNNTDVLLDFPSGSTVAVVLSKYEIFQYLTSVSEPIAGTIVSANKPVVVHAGHPCANIPDQNTEFCDLLMENIPPIDTLGSVFVVPYQRGRTMYTISVVAPHDSTTVDIWDINGNSLETIMMNSQDSIIRNFYASEILSITSSQNILVSQYGHGSNNIYGDPSQTNIPALTQFINRVSFEIPDIFFNPSVVSIIIDSQSDVSRLKLNGNPIVAVESASVLIPGIGTYNVIYIDVISNVAYSLFHDIANVTFGAILIARNDVAEFTTAL